MQAKIFRMGKVGMEHKSWFNSPGKVITLIFKDRGEQ